MKLHVTDATNLVFVKLKHLKKMKYSCHAASIF